MDNVAISAALASTKLKGKGMKFRKSAVAAATAVALMLAACGGGSGGGGGGGFPVGLIGPGTDDPGTQGPGTQGPGTQGPGTPGPGTQEPGTQEPGTPAPAQYETLPSAWDGDKDSYIASVPAVVQQLNDQGAKGSVRMRPVGSNSLYVNPQAANDKYSYKEFTLTFSGRDGWDGASNALLQRLEDEGAKGYVLHHLVGETHTLDDSLNAIRKASFILVKNESQPVTYTYRKFSFDLMMPADFIAQLNAWGQEGYRFLNTELGLSPSVNAIVVKSSAAAGATYSYAFEPIVSDPKPQLTSRGQSGFRYRGYFEYFANRNGQPVRGVFNTYELDSSKPAAVAYRFSDEMPGGPVDINTTEGLARLNDQASQGFFYAGLSVPTGASGGAAMFFADYAVYVQGALLADLNRGGAVLFP